MGEVYRARDTRLDRSVAIKILPQEVSSDPVRKQRFEREAKTISSLNHPNICTLHDIGSQDGIEYLVMECVEGETLAKRLERGPLPLEQVLRYGAQLAYALDRAHRAGIVHRDLKPGNVMLTTSGAKLLDFGLAKPVVPLVSGATLTAAATQTTPVTQEGSIVGTFQYMSPEQVEGKELDGRSDIFSLGAVLYEMVTGLRAFGGKSQLSVASAILEKEPASINSIKPMTPPGLDHAIRRCLAKDPEERWQMARDLALELKWIAEGSSQASVSAPFLKAGRNRERLAWAVAAVLAVASLAGFFAYQRLARPPASVLVSDLAAPKGTKYNSLVNGRAAISPDGHAVVFAARDASGRSSLWVRALDGSPAQVIPGTEDAGQPFWSPDSRRIGSSQHGKLIIIDPAGGSTVALVDGSSPGGASWSRSGTILFAGTDGIYRVPATGGSAVLVVPRMDKYFYFFGPTFLPDGIHFLYQATKGLPDAGYQGDLFWASLDGRENRLLLRGILRAEYASGYLLHVRGASLVAQLFEPETGQLTGTEHEIVAHVQQSAFNSLFNVSQNGMLIYEPATRATPETQLAWYDRTGKQLASIGAPGFYPDLRLSPDAHKLASSVGAPKSEMWVDDLDRGVRMRLTFDPETDNGIPVWSPDGSTLLFSTLHGSKAGVGIFKKASNGAGNLELVLPSDRTDREAWATDWSRDGRFVLFSRGRMFNNVDADIWVLPMTGERKPTLFVHAAATAFDAQFSPDGHWVAYTSSESGRSEVYVVSFDAAKALSGASGSVAGGKWIVSADGGAFARWRRDGKELFYIGPGNSVMAVEVDGKGASFNVGRSQRLFVAPVNPVGTSYDVTPDGQKFVMGSPPEEDEPPLVLMQNWMARLETK
jgi:serine/threonine protein kinase/Tol biopolymer transport system component